MNSVSGIYRICYYKFYLKVPLSAIPVDFQVYGMYVFGTEMTKKMLGDDVSEEEQKHHFNVKRAVNGDIIYTDDWVDARGRARHDEIKNPLFIHIAADVMELQSSIKEIKKHVGMADGPASK